MPNPQTAKLEIMNKEKINIKTNPQETENNSLSVVEAKVIKKCEHLTEHREYIKINDKEYYKSPSGKRMIQYVTTNVCNKKAISIITYGKRKVYACKMHDNHYRKRAIKYGWELPESISL